MTTYAQFLAGDTNIKHGVEREGGKALVLGWLVTNVNDPSSADLMERRYALRLDGNIACTEWRKYNESFFGQRDLVWFMRADIPADAEYIGQYVDTGINWE